ncbi:tripartite tricarboxylate transporter family receptor [Variibacter gotjawalensis]|uniref:Tripartite tricarboxylate transporter family receptor n=1 Tax=Variibacter gotjawalensis TaxID=1333996 RepID=A0A0S3PU97_9BRAD|nr:tripartite tricarboxylate transporter substrate binding protein [Variibacter gotjawalensis]NIK49781.1 tripartite-type tricarboxylate transporter receptor subunit TctC [Variibacter gotjawalensis]RZS45786.1 tripartite-type tricarboxylate transporter receptor subunit TctC [Variibacter gotjawalensis]BAT59459.1 tripartite tricarboxylate transporter family receptor [Variibacter gotjawalensis]
MPFNVARFAHVLIAAFAVASVLPAAAETYPDRPIKLVIPFTPGGVTDNVGRLVADRMSRELGQPIIVENRAGANGRIGTDVVAKSPPDGYTLLLGSVGAFAIHPHMVKAPYDPVNDFIPVSLVATNDVVIVQNPKLPPKTPAEFIAYLKENNGKLQYGSSGVGSPTHLATEMFRRQIGIDIVHVPYRGDSAAISDVVAGVVSFSFSTVSATISLIESGHLRAIASTGLQRSKRLPDVPTLAESGLPGFNAENWVGIFAPAKTPDAIVERIYKAIKIALADPEVERRLIAGGNTIVGSDTAGARKFIEDENKKWGEIVRAGNIKLME